MMITQREQRLSDVLYGIMLRLEYARDDRNFRFPEQRVQFLHEAMGDCITEAQEVLGEREVYASN